MNSLFSVMRMMLTTCASVGYTFLPTSYAGNLSKYILDLIGIEKYTVLGKEHLDTLRASGKPFLVAFHHPTCFDHLVLLKELGPLRFVMKKEYACLGIRQIAEKYDVLMIHEKGGTVTMIQEQANDVSQPPLAIAPAGGYAFEDPHEVAPFRSGAFVPLVPIVPVILRYSPHEYWEHDKGIFETIWKRFTKGVLYYSLQVLPPIIPTETTTVTDLQEATRLAFQKGLQTMPIAKPWVPQKNHVSLFTSWLFAFPALLMYIRGHYNVAISIFFTHVLSVAYHNTTHVGLKTLDLTCNILHSAIYIIYLAYKECLLPIAFLIYAGAFYLIVQGQPEWFHAVYVHGPVILGWCTIAWMES